jgi:hypothetical protein
MAKVVFQTDDSAQRGATVAFDEPEQTVAVVDDEGHVQSQVRIRSASKNASKVKIVVVPEKELPEELPDWAMDLASHASTFQRTAVYRCTSCGGEHEEYRQNPRDLPYAKVCGCVKEAADGSIETCTAPALRRLTLPGQGVALNARRFEPLVVYQNAADPSKISVPGRNNEPTEAGYKRVELTNMADYNRFVKQVNASEKAKMTDHRDMHRYYWEARRDAMREHVDARRGQDTRIIDLVRAVRKRSDQKTAKRYGKGLDPHFHSQLMEMNQSNMQDYCDKDTGWKATRAR